MNLEEHAAEQTGSARSCSQADRGTETGQPHRLRKDEAAHRGGGRAQRQPDRDLAIALPDLGRHHGIEADVESSSADDPEDAEQERVEPGAASGASSISVKGATRMT